MKGRTNVSGGVVLNATSVNCIVEDGNTIVAGDFVQTSYHPTLEENTLPFTQSTSDYHNTVFTLASKDILQAFYYIANYPTSYHNIFFYVYNGETLTNLNSTSIDLGANQKMYSFEFVNVSDSRFIMVATTFYGSTYQTNVFDFSYNTTTGQIALNNKTQIYSGSANFVNAMLYGTDKLVIWYATTMCLYDLTTNTVIHSISTSVSNEQPTDNQYKRVPTPKLFLYDTNKFIAIRPYGSSANYSISNNEISEISYNSSGTGTGQYNKVVRVSERVFYAFNAHKSSASGHTSLGYTKYTVNNDDSISVANFTSSETYAYKKRYPLNISNDAFIIEIDETTINIAIINDETTTPAYENIYTFTGGDTSDFVLNVQIEDSSNFRILFDKVSTGVVYALNCVVASGEISVTPNTTYVKEYETRCNGVAKQNGSAGDTISVYIPTNS